MSVAAVLGDARRARRPHAGPAPARARLLPHHVDVRADARVRARRAGPQRPPHPTPSPSPRRERARARARRREHGRARSRVPPPAHFIPPPSSLPVARKHTAARGVPGGTRSRSGAIAGSISEPACCCCAVCQVQRHVHDYGARRARRAAAGLVDGRRRERRAVVAVGPVDVAAAGRVRRAAGARAPAGRAAYGCAARAAGRAASVGRAPRARAEGALLGVQKAGLRSSSGCSVPAINQNAKLPRRRARGRARSRAARPAPPPARSPPGGGPPLCRAAPPLGAPRRPRLVSRALTRTSTTAWGGTSSARAP